MVDKTRLYTGGATLSIAAAIGFVMQNGDAIAGRTELAAVAPDQAQEYLPRSDSKVLAAFLPIPPREATMPFALPSVRPNNYSSRVAALTMAIDTELQSDVQTPQFLQKSCDLDLTALPQPGAMVRLNLGASCYQGQRILVEHSGIEFADITGVDGSYSVDIPAMNEYAPFAVSFVDGNTVEAKTLTLTLDGYERVAVTWAGDTSLHLHAMEYGADFGDSGHVWANAARDPKYGVDAEGGFLTQLGNPDAPNPVLAEVYSFPFDRVKEDGSVDLFVEAELTANSCGTEISGKSLQLSGQGGLKTMEIAFFLPQCDGESGYLVLNNLFQDLKIAHN